MTSDPEGQPTATSPSRHRAPRRPLDRHLISLLQGTAALGGRRVAAPAPCRPRPTPADGGLGPLTSVVGRRRRAPPPAPAAPPTVLAGAGPALVDADALIGKSPEEVAAGLAPMGPAQRHSLEQRVAKVPPERTRNFSIIAHIDHGKSTLADRLLQATGAVDDRDLQAQFLDNNEIERERGITIKLQSSRMLYTSPSDGLDYILNLIDTPGHVDFSYEVSRSLAACEGALLVVDAAQGIEAQTLANVYLAIDAGLEVVPVVNKIDLPAAEPGRVLKEIESTLGLPIDTAVLCSAKSGLGIPDVLEAVVAYVPPPEPDQEDKPLRALIFDSYYDEYRGVIAYFRVMEGCLKERETVRFMNTACEYECTEVGVLSPYEARVAELRAGEVGWLAGSIKSVADARVGDTITLAKRGAKEAWPGYAEATPMVYAGLFPSDSDDFQKLREALGKLQLNDAALQYEPEVSSAMGFGFRVGFLGLLHMDVVQQRLEREHDMDLIVTAPTVSYRCVMTNGDVVSVRNASEMPDPGRRECIEEPYCRLEALCPREYVGDVMELAQQRRGELVDMSYVNEERATLKYDIPLAEIVTDFFDELKSRSRGYASMQYQLTDYRPNDLVRLDVRLNGEEVTPLALVCHRDKAYKTGKALVEALKEFIPRQMFRIPIQACIGAKPIASAAIQAYRKDVLAKCYGGDVSRKKKLLKKQAAGKKRMKQFGKVEVPQDAFMAVLKVNRTVNDEGGSE